MSSYLCATITFLGDEFHGRRDGGEPEWPPSPLRLFQALVAAGAARWRDDFVATAGDALRWLESQAPPVIIAPRARTGSPYRLSVPNNAMDIVGRAWARDPGGELSKDASPATHRAMKTVRASLVPDQECVYYLWPLTDGVDVARLAQACDGLSAVGRGVDLVAACVRAVSAEEAAGLGGERWSPADAGGPALRVPQPGTLDGLVRRHQAFLGRLDNGVLSPVPPLTAFRQVGYRRATDPAPRPFAAFALLRTDGGSFRPFDPVRRTGMVAGMVRHVVAKVARLAGRDEGWINSFVLGHTPDGREPLRGGSDVRRFAYLPLPSLERRGDRGEHVGSIRRMLVVGPPGGEAEVAWLRRGLSGCELIEEGSGQPIALLALIPNDDRQLRGYVGPAEAWSTVTPMVLAGHHEGERRKAERLVRRSLTQAGLPEELAESAEVEWRREGYRAGVDLATRYEVPRCQQGRLRYHLRVCWRGLPQRGPLAIGAGRYAGLGLLAAEGG